MSLNLNSVYSHADDLPGKGSSITSLLGYVEYIEFAMKRYRDLLDFLQVSKMRVTVTVIHVIRSTRCHCQLFVEILRACSDRLKRLDEEEEKLSAKVLAASNDAKQFHDQMMRHFWHNGVSAFDNPGLVIGGFDRRNRFIRRVHNYDRQREILPGGQLGRITPVPPAAVDYELRFRGLASTASVDGLRENWAGQRNLLKCGAPQGEHEGLGVSALAHLPILATLHLDGQRPDIRSASNTADAPIVLDEESEDGRHRRLCFGDQGRKLARAAGGSLDPHSSSHFACDRKGCDKMWSMASTLRRHLRREHDWIPQRCTEPGCTDETLIGGYNNLVTHCRHHHAAPAGEPTACAVPDCRSKTLFVIAPRYQIHLRLAHQLRRRKTGACNVGKPSASIGSWRKSRLRPGP
ncbi:MAG: hypothetical protein M1826_004547 [Phylliscum demangeonii]|nr:MAG: hypothetical protein M1826_004547 [Phylliscum demangeonii]